MGKSLNETCRLILDFHDNQAVTQLKAIGRPVVPFLINALAYPRTRTHYRKTGAVLDPQSPFARICDLLEEFHPPAAAASLAAYLDHPVRGMRKRAALCLGSIAAPDCIEPVKRALADPDKEVHFDTMMGIERALKLSPGSDRSPSHADRAFLNDVFPAIARLLNERDWAGHAPRILLRIDRERAIPLLLAAKCLSPANPNLEHILRALNDAHYQIPHRLLLPLLTKLDSRSGMPAVARPFAQALIAYANNPEAATEAKLRSLLASPDETIAAKAAEALAVMRGMDKIFHRILQIEKRDGFDALSEPQKRYYAVFLYDADVRNGGHLQYLGNFAPRDFHLAVYGLRAVQAPKRAAILEEGLQVFGRSAPPKSRRRRHQILNGLTKRQRKVLSDLDQRYYEGRENVNKLLALYAVNHKKEFAPERVRRRSS